MPMSRRASAQAVLPFPVRRTEERWHFTFIDLFSGIGGFRLALESLGGRCVFSCEIDRFARKTYAKWFGEKEEPEGNPHFALDIRQVSAEDVRRAARARSGDVRRPDRMPKSVPTVLAAGFPCQPFSIAGVSKKNSLGRPHGLACDRQGNLFFEILRLASELRIPALILENVKHLRSHNGGRTWRIIQEHLTSAGYIVLHRVIDAAWWVPQHRERTFIVCIHRRYGFRRNPSVRARLEALARKGDFFQLEYPQQPCCTLRELLQSHTGEDKTNYTISPRLWNYLQSYRDKHRAKGNGFGFGLVYPERTVMTRTLSARYYKDGSEILIWQGRNRPPRKLTPVESAWLMGFRAKVRSRSDIPVSDTRAWQQLGNAVVPAVVEAVATALLRLLEKTGVVLPDTDILVESQPASRSALS